MTDITSSPVPYRSGFAAIIGRSNVGKSTLLNALVGEKVAIVSDRAQTTRNRIQGVVTRPGWQLVLIDTPGIHKPSNRLGEFMAKEAQRAMDAVEAVFLVLDVKAGIGRVDRELLEKLRHAPCPVFILLNKCDIAAPEWVERAEQEVTELGFTRILRVSALTHLGLEELEQAVSTLLPEGPQYFPDDMITDQPERVIAAEMIREKAINLLHEEVPHGVGVEILSIKPRPEGELLDVSANIYCERDGHKGILIGKRGERLKQIGSQAREEMEALFGRKIFLELWVKVNPDWRNKASALRDLGYDGQ